MPISSKSSLWAELPTPFVIAHRGDKTHAPENTLAAFLLAAQVGADAIEFDVKLSADQEVIVLHDQRVDRTTNGKGRVGRLPYVTLRDLDAGSWFSAKFRGEKIPALGEVFETVGDRLLMNIELTNYATPFDHLVERVVACVRKYKMEKRILFSSFYAGNLIHVNRLLPGMPCGLLAWPGWLGWFSRIYRYRTPIFWALHPFYADVSSSLVERVHAAGKRVHAWTVDGEESLNRMFSMGTDGVFTDDPAIALNALGRKT